MMIYLLFTLLIVLASLDSWLTRKALKCGCLREANWIMDKLGKWKYIFKGLVVVTIGASLSSSTSGQHWLLLTCGWLTFVTVTGS